MRSYIATNVNDALMTAVSVIQQGGVPVMSRGMETLEVPGPVCFTYEKPIERVLFHSKRDINPFFHLFEALWILAGRKDVAFLEQFVPRMYQFSDDGETYHAAYGYRLRYEAGFDQLSSVIELLQRKPDTRQAVLQIWDARLDLGTESCDIPCNNLVYLKIRDGRLRMTVLNRSNDVLWGSLGTNYVQFSFIQEYIASNLEIPVGEYAQISDSYHVYTTGPGGQLWDKLKDFVPEPDPYVYQQISPMQLIEVPHIFDSELLKMFELWRINHKELPAIEFREPFLRNVAVPMYNAWAAHRAGDIDLARGTLSLVKADDWRICADQWLARRVK